MATAKEPSIPLRSSDGIVYVWACGTCHHVSAPYEKSVCLAPDEVAGFAEASRARADRCCTCASCGARMPKGGSDSKSAEDDDKVPLATMLRRLGPNGQWCVACEEKERPELEARARRIEQERAAFAVRAEASLARSPDPESARRIPTILEDISEGCYAASWLSGVEFDLWEMMYLPSGGGHPYRESEGRPGLSFGMGEVSESDLTTLRELHEKAGGWWHWEDEEGTLCAGGPVFVTTEEWLAIVAAKEVQWEILRALPVEE